MSDIVTVIEDVKKDLLPDEIKFICKMCHIAANKRMASKVECAEKNVTGEYCKPVEKLRRAYHHQSIEIDLSRKYISVFIAFFNGRSTFRKNELLKIYESNIVESERSFDEFLDFCKLNGIEIVGD